MDYSQDDVIDVAPLSMVIADDSIVQRPRKMHARKSTASSVPKSFSARDKEGSAYVHKTISEIVTRILNEDHKVDGVSVPLSTQLPVSESSKKN